MKFTNYIEQTYDAVLTVERDEDIQQPNLSWKTDRVTVYENKPCGVYVHRAEEFDRRRSVQPETGDFRIFTDNQLLIYKGDHLTFTQYGRTYKTICGDPMVYETHQEIVCRQETVASGSYREGEIQ